MSKIRFSLVAFLSITFCETGLASSLDEAEIISLSYSYAASEIVAIGKVDAADISEFDADTFEFLSERIIRGKLPAKVGLKIKQGHNVLLDKGSERVIVALENCSIDKLFCQIKLLTPLRELPDPDGFVEKIDNYQTEGASSFLIDFWSSIPELKMESMIDYEFAQIESAHLGFLAPAKDRFGLDQLLETESSGIFQGCSKFRFIVKKKLIGGDSVIDLILSNKILLNRKKNKEELRQLREQLVIKESRKEDHNEKKWKVDFVDKLIDDTEKFDLFSDDFILIKKYSKVEKINCLGQRTFTHNEFYPLSKLDDESFSVSLQGKLINKLLMAAQYNVQ